MTRTQTSAIALALGTLFTAHAMAATTHTPTTREQVRAELAAAIRTGNIVTGESSDKLNEQYPQLYPQQQARAGMTRAQVRAELARAVRTGNIAPGESGVKLNESYPQRYPAQQHVASKSRNEVKAELADAISTGLLRAHIEA